MKRIITAVAAVGLAASLVACAGGGDVKTASSTKSTTAATTPATANTHTASSGEPALMRVPGYAYEDAGAAEVDAVDSRLGLLNALAGAAWPKLTQGVYVSWSSHAVLASPTDQVGVLVLVNLNPEYFVVNPAATPDSVATAVAQAIANSESTTHETIAGQQVAVVTDANSTSFFAWERDNVAAVVVAMGTGPDKAKAQDFVTAYLNEANR